MNALSVWLPLRWKLILLVGGCVVLTGAMIMSVVWMIHLLIT